MIGTTVAHYRILKPLGEGGMGIVYLAEDVRLDRKVVLKFLLPSRAASAEAKARFMQEARAASSLNCPNICTVYDIGETDDERMFIAMAHYDGETLCERLTRGSLSVPEAVKIACHVGSGLAEGHRKFIVHRDIKPSNIMIARDGRAVILDFGIAKLMGSPGRLTEMGSRLGTVGYMSPEQAKGLDVVPATDVWSLGVVLFEMLTGRLPFQRDYDQAVIYSIINEEPPDVGSLVEDLPAPVVEFVGRCLSKSPDERPVLEHSILDRLRRAVRDGLSHGPAAASLQSGSQEPATEDHRSEVSASTVTLFFSDLEGSTRLLDQMGSRYAEVLESVRSIIRNHLEDCGGEEIDTAGDGMFACFRSASGAVRAAIEIQRAVSSRTWPEGAAVQLRIGMHTGEPIRKDAGLVGMDVHRAARICSAAHGGQVLASEATQAVVSPAADLDIRFVDLGEYRLKDISAPMRLYQVVGSGTAAHVYRPRAEGVGGELPVTLTDLVGRDREMEELTALLTSDVRLVTLTGPGGTGKSRLAIELARRVASNFEHGVCFVGLAPIIDPQLFLPAVARELGIPENPAHSVRDSLVEHLRAHTLLLVLDNFEQVVEAAPDVADLLSELDGLTILTTSRTALRIRGEREFRVPTLPFPDGPAGASRLDYASYPAVRLFVERARTVRPDFDLAGNEDAVAGICRRVDGLPAAQVALRHLSGSAT